MAKPKKGERVFRMKMFMDWLNQTLLPKYEVPALPKRERKGATTTCVDDESSGKFRKIGESTALRWAHQLGASYDTYRKSYYVDGHDSDDVLRYRAAWLRREQQLEYRQYRSKTQVKREVISVPLLTSLTPPRCLH